MKKEKAKQKGQPRAKRPYQRHPIGMRQSAVERMGLGVNVSALAQELGIKRSLLYVWKRRGAPAKDSESEGGPIDLREQTIQDLQAKIAGLEAELGRTALETRFFRGALRRIEESRQSSKSSGGTASTPKSGA